MGSLDAQTSAEGPRCSGFVRRCFGGKSYEGRAGPDVQIFVQGQEGLDGLSPADLEDLRLRVRQRERHPGLHFQSEIAELRWHGVVARGLGLGCLGEWGEQ